MPNPLRSPAVLIALLSTLYWVFSPTRSTDPQEARSEPNQDKLVLRVPTKETRPVAPLPPAKQRSKRPSRAAIRAQKPHQLTSVPSENRHESTATIRAQIRGITPLPNAKPESVTSPSAAKPSRPRASEPQYVTHVIVDGDDLRRLATQYLGRADRFYEIFQANPDLLQRPDVLPVGQSLRIPVGQ